MTAIILYLTKVRALSAMEISQLIQQAFLTLSKTFDLVDSIVGNFIPLVRLQCEWPYHLIFTPKFSKYANTFASLFFPAQKYFSMIFLIFVLLLIFTCVIIIFPWCIFFVFISWVIFFLVLSVFTNVIACMSCCIVFCFCANTIYQVLNRSCVLTHYRIPWEQLVIWVKDSERLTSKLLYSSMHLPTIRSISVV